MFGLTECLLSEFKDGDPRDAERWWSQKVLLGLSFSFGR